MALAVAEIFLATFLFDFDVPLIGIGYWQNPVIYANVAAKVGVLAIILLSVLLWPQRAQIAASYRNAITADTLGYGLCANALLFATLIFVRFQFSMSAGVSFGDLALYAGLMLATGASLAFIAAPLRFWIGLAKGARIEIPLAIGASGFTIAAGYLAKQGWSTLASATLSVSHSILNLYEPHTFLDVERRILGVGNFRVEVMEACSGYEGVALIIAVLAIYMWVFRASLRFPNALLLFPIGVATIWMLNAVRIAMLISIGAHASPQVAVQGFHSEAGWLFFLAVALGCVAISRRMPMFSADAVPRAKRVKREPQPALLYLAPFVALMGSSIVASAFAPHDQWLYPLRVVAIGAVLWWLRDGYRHLVQRVAPLSVVAGALVGFAWIATAPAETSPSELGVWLAALPLWAAIAWLALRAIGTTVLVPIAEELAFRGYLARVLVAANFDRASFAQFSWLALIVSSVAFGLVHQRWLAAFLAGIVYALLMYRYNRMSDPIAAHAASNAVIVGWAIAMQQWSLI